MSIFDLVSVLSPVHMAWVRLWTRARFVGADQFGNRYYEAKPRPGTNRPRRFIKYKGAPEASKVPPEWHGWLHYQTDAIPSSGTPSYRRPWQKPHRPNMTGTTLAYRPPGHVLSDSKRDKATGDYEAWSPPQ